MAGLGKEVYLNLNSYCDNLEIPKIVCSFGFFCKTAANLDIYSRKSMSGPCTEQAC